MRRSLWLLGLTVLVALGSDKALTGAARTIGGGDRWQFRLRLSAPEPNIQREPSRPEWGQVLSIPTFGHVLHGDEGRPGAAIPLPVKVVRVAIPEGAEVRLEALQASRKLLKGMRLGPEKAAGRGRPGAQSGPTAAPEIGETDGSSADHSHVRREAWAGEYPYVRLGATGYLRFQKFVEIEYTPLIPTGWGTDAAGAPTTDLDFFSEVDLLLEVDGVDWEEIDRERAEVPADPHFEGTYRATLVNYEEGRAWRTRKTRHTGSAAGAILSSAASPAGAALVPPMSYPFAGATTPVYRLGVSANGIYRLSHSYLLAPGTGVAPGLAGAAPGTFKILHQGVEIPIRVVTAVSGTFASGDYIEFYGQGSFGEPDLTVNQAFDPNSGFATIYQAGDYTDVNAYFLFAEPGTRQRIPSLTGTFNAGLPLETAFTDTIRREYDQRFVPDGLNDPFYQWPPIVTLADRHNPDPNAPNCGYNNPGVQTISPFFGPVSASGETACAACDLNLPPADPTAGANVATVRVRMRGGTTDPTIFPDHMTVVQIGTGTTPSSTLCWDGEALVEQTVTAAQSSLAGGAGIYIGQPGLSNFPGTEGFFVDWIEVSNYRRLFKLAGGESFGRFANATSSYQASGFTSNAPAGDMVVYDVSRTISGTTVPSPQLVTGATVVQLAPSDFAVKFSLSQDATLPPGAPRLFAAAFTGGFRLPSSAEVVSGDDLTDTSNEADMVVITSPDVAGVPLSSAYQSYIAHREADSGLSIRTVMIKDVYDQFSAGARSPEAMRAFLAYALDNWAGPSGLSAPPAYVMLLGDATVDYKNNVADPNWVDQVPTFVMYVKNFILDYYASDTYIAAFRGADQLPDIHLGRIPTRNGSEMASVFQKLTNYDTIAPTGTWRAKGLFLADKGDPGTGETEEFERISNEFSGTYFASPFSFKRIYYDDPNYVNGLDWAHWRSDFVAAADAGAGLTSYIGHGNFTDWGKDPNGLFVSFSGRDDFTLLSETQKPTLLINENCLIGGFHALGPETLGERFLKVPGKGAIAVFAPSGLSFLTSGETINDAVYPAMFGVSKERRFGNLITAARIALGFSVFSTSDLQAYVLLGDPAQRAIIPAPRPPTGLAAMTDLNGRVDLSWSPGPDPGVVTRIYRREAFNGTYVQATPPQGVAGTAFSDTTVINGKAYFYRAVSVDPNGPFEGAVSNLNDTCNFSNPPASDPNDCVWAIPRNPNPPAPPAAVSVANPGVGDRLIISWSPVGEPDISQYTLRYGVTNNGPYNSTISVGAATTSVIVSGLTIGQSYYFVVTATNFSGLTSVFSEQATGIPLVFEGAAPPDMVTTLDLRRAPSQPVSIELLWTAPPLDIYGSPTAIDSFSIYRGTIASFVADTAHRIAAITDPSAGSYIDPNSFASGPDYFYLITASDTNGLASGAGRQLPNGISDLALSVNGMNLMLSWSAVTTDIDANPTLIDHYVVYAAALPVDRYRIEALSPLIPSIPGSPAQTAVPPGLVYYSVIAVDVRGNKSPF